MIFHHPKFLFDLRPHTCEEGRANGLSRVPFGSLSSSSCAQSPALGPSVEPAHTAVRALKGGTSLPRWRVLSQHIFVRRRDRKLGIRRKAKSSALRYVARIDPSGQFWLPSYRCRCSPLLVASAPFTAPSCVPMKKLYYRSPSKVALGHQRTESPSPPPTPTKLWHLVLLRLLCHSPSAAFLPRPPWRDRICFLWPFDTQFRRTFHPP